MSLSLFGDDEEFPETGTYSLLHGDEDLVDGVTGALPPSATWYATGNNVVLAGKLTSLRPPRHKAGAPAPPSRLRQVLRADHQPQNQSPVRRRRRSPGIAPEARTFWKNGSRGNSAG